MDNAKTYHGYDYGSRENIFHNPKARTTRALLWLLLLALIAVAAVLAFYFGRQHRIILDNGYGNKEAATGAYMTSVGDFPLMGYTPGPAAPPEKESLMKLSFNPMPAEDISLKTPKTVAPGERTPIKVTGPGFLLKVAPSVDFTDGRVDAEPLEFYIDLGFRKNALVDLPALVAGRDDYLKPFPGGKEEREAREKLLEKGGRPGAIDMGADKKDEPAYKRPGAIDMDNEQNAEEPVQQPYKRPGAIE